MYIFDYGWNYDWLKLGNNRIVIPVFFEFFCLDPVLFRVLTIVIFYCNIVKKSTLELNSISSRRKSGQKENDDDVLYATFYTNPSLPCDFYNISFLDYHIMQVFTLSQFRLIPQLYPTRDYDPKD